MRARGFTGASRLSSSTASGSAASASTSTSPRSISRPESSSRETSNRSAGRRRRPRSEVGSASLGFGASLIDTKIRRPQLGQADFPSSKRVLQDLHSSMPGSSAGRLAA